MFHSATLLYSKMKQAMKKQSNTIKINMDVVKQRLNICSAMYLNEVHGPSVSGELCWLPQASIISLIILL
jgi:hypothetical protein